MKISLEASSSAREVGFVPLVVMRDGAVFSMVCFMPEFARSEVVWGRVADGDILNGVSGDEI